jgi:hypothetical protein
VRNLNLGSEPTILEGSSSIPYFAGLVLGQIFFNFIFIIGTLTFKKAVFSISNLPYSVWLKKINFFFLTLTLGLSLSSVPYYSFDYLLGSPLGFVSQDKAFSKSILSQNELEDPNRLLTSIDGGFPLTIDTDISYFDRANYGDQLGFFQKNFEELNYQSEYAWTSRRDKKPNLYTSAQTTKTTILQFFQAQTNQTDSAIIDEDGPRTVQSKLPDWFKKSTGKDRQKLKKRFETNYGDMKESENFVLGDSFGTFPLYNDTKTPSEKTIKKKFYSNPIYQLLLNSEIDAYLKRSPDHVLTGKEESDIFLKRKFLTDYYDTMRAYQKIPYHEEFQEFFQGSKTFVDRAYHHQFKGNLKVVSKYFNLSWNQDALFREGSVATGEQSLLKYDQPLYLSNDLEEHEELDKPLLSSPFLELSESIPFYLGYDENSGQVITTRFGADSPTSRGPNSDWERWPVSRERLLVMEKSGSSSFVTLFRSSLNPDMKSILSTLLMTRNSDNITAEVSNFKLSGKLKYFGKTVPAHLKYIGKSYSEPLTPNYGGLMWSGDQSETKN